MNLRTSKKGSVLGVKAMYLISVYFDDKTNRILQRYINQIAERTGNAFMTEKNVPPHMTISSIEARSVDVLIPAFESLISHSHGCHM